MSDPATVAPFGTPLTDRERAVIDAVWRTGSIPSAARDLRISRHTARNHLANARSRLGARTTIEAIRLTLA